MSNFHQLQREIPRWVWQSVTWRFQHLGLQISFQSQGKGISTIRESQSSDQRFGLKVIFKGYPVQSHCHLQLDQVIQSSDPGCFQRWSVYHQSGQLVLVFPRLHCKILLVSNLNWPFSSLKLLLHVLMQQVLLKSLFPSWNKLPGTVPLELIS